MFHRYARTDSGITTSWRVSIRCRRMKKREAATTRCSRTGFEKPALFGGQGVEAMSKWAEDWTVYRRQIGEPKPFRVRLDMRTARDGKFAEPQQHREPRFGFARCATWQTSFQKPRKSANKKQPRNHLRKDRFGARENRQRTNASG